jgi:hypothetical protein
MSLDITGPPLRGVPLLPINDCPFCQSMRVDVILRWNVCCDNCEAIGPIGKTPDDAIRLWNKASE